MKLSDVYTWELAGFQNQLIRHFMLAVDVVGVGIWEFVSNTDGPAFLERELVRLGMDGCWWDWVWLGTGRSEFAKVQVERCPLAHLESI